MTTKLQISNDSEHVQMFCFQCEQTANGVACTSARGVCGKDDVTAALQDLLVHGVKGIAQYNWRARKLGRCDRDIDRFICDALFVTVTNVNFDPDAIEGFISCAKVIRDRARDLYLAAAKSGGITPEDVRGPATWIPAPNRQGLVAQARAISILARKERLGPDLVGLQELLLYGLKGMAAYAHHAAVFGYESDEVYNFFSEALTYLAEADPKVDELVSLCLQCGEMNLKTMELLDKAHTSTYGHPVPTPVRVEPVAGKAILVSGHDLKDLEELLKQTVGTGINVYTHGEMLPAHGYPGLKRYPHLVGHYGTAWQNQKREFADFPGAILMTTNCLQEPQVGYRDRIFTCGLVGWPGVPHIRNRDFGPVIESALDAPGFQQTGPEKTIMVGFGHQSVIRLADRILDAINRGRIRHFFLIGGCDGARPGRNYYTRLAELVPKDCVILTLACGKFRFNRLDFGYIDDLPRLLDIGQCNDAYSAIQIALALARAAGTEVNKLPLSLILSWYEQKAVAILLTLLYLGIRGIRLGPTLPAFLSPHLMQVLAEKFDLRPITTPEQDLQNALGNVR